MYQTTSPKSTLYYCLKSLLFSIQPYLFSLGESFQCWRWCRRWPWKQKLLLIFLLTIISTEKPKLIRCFLPLSHIVRNALKITVLHWMRVRDFIRKCLSKTCRFQKRRSSGDVLCRITTIDSETIIIVKGQHMKSPWQWSVDSRDGRVYLVESKT